MRRPSHQLAEDNRDDATWRLAGVAAAFLAGWVAGRVANQGSVAGESKLVPDPNRLPGAVKISSYAVSGVAYPIVYLPLSLGAAALLAKRGVEHAGAVPRTALAAWLTYHVVKSLVHRERPTSEQGSASADRSYPSGHATAAAAIATSAAMLLQRSERVQTTDVVWLLAGVPFLVGASRVALARHWPTDVVGGWATGIAVASHVTANR